MELAFLYLVLFTQVAVVVGLTTERVQHRTIAQAEQAVAETVPVLLDLLKPVQMDLAAVVVVHTPISQEIMV